jgi:hypothetical protein
MMMIKCHLMKITKLTIPKPQTDYRMRHVELHVSCFHRPTKRYICQFMPLAISLPATSLYVRSHPRITASYTASSRQAAQHVTDDSPSHLLADNDNRPSGPPMTFTQLTSYYRTLGVLLCRASVPRNRCDSLSRAAGSERLEL